jgi:hypothetical protein
MKISTAIATYVVLALGAWAKLQDHMGLCRDDGDCINSARCGPGLAYSDAPPYKDSPRNMPWTYMDPQKTIANVPQVKDEECNMLLQLTVSQVRIFYPVHTEFRLIRLY